MAVNSGLGVTGSPVMPAASPSAAAGAVSVAGATAGSVVVVATSGAGVAGMGVVGAGAAGSPSLSPSLLVCVCSFSSVILISPISIYFLFYDLILIPWFRVITIKSPINPMLQTYILLSLYYPLW